MGKQTISPYKAFRSDIEARSRHQRRDVTGETWVYLGPRSKSTTPVRNSMVGEKGSCPGQPAGLTRQSLFCKCFPTESLPGLLPFFGGFLSSYLLLVSHSPSVYSPRKSKRTSVLSDDKRFIILAPPQEGANAKLPGFHKWKILKPRKSFPRLKKKKKLYHNLLFQPKSLCISMLIALLSCIISS